MRVRWYYPLKILKTQMLNPAFWWLLAVKFLAFWKLRPRSCKDQYIVGPLTYKLGDQSPPVPMVVAPVVCNDKVGVIVIMLLSTGLCGCWWCIMSGPIPMFIGSELFRQGPRPKAMAVVGLALWTASFVIAIGFEPLQVSRAAICPSVTIN